MEIIILLLITAIIIAIAFFVVCVVVSAINYIKGEVNHSIKNIKRALREFMWNVEWKWNHR